jgi:DNA-binding MurR/RpiR family transcriptional regulator
MPKRATAEDVLQRLQEHLGNVTRQQRIAAQFILDHPHDVGVSSLRQFAAAADVTPNTLVRLAQSIGFRGFEALQQPFKDAARRGPISPLDREEWLEALGQADSAGHLLKAAAGTALGNLETLFAGVDAQQLDQLAMLVLKARATYVLGVGTLAPAAKMFTALARMTLDTVHAIPADGSLPLDDLAGADARDLLLGMTFSPYRREVVDAVMEAKRRGVTIAVLTDSWRSPAATHADMVFTIPVASPHVFASVVGIAAFLELLFAFVLKAGKEPAAERVHLFHKQRFEMGIYWTDD